MFSDVFLHRYFVNIINNADKVADISQYPVIRCCWLLSRSSFDPNRGLFRLTKDNMLYPNPGVHLLYDDFPMHYYFVGRMLGKVSPIRADVSVCCVDLRLAVACVFFWHCVLLFVVFVVVSMFFIFYMEFNR